jgi:hypothetical protein
MILQLGICPVNSNTSDNFSTSRAINLKSGERENYRKTLICSDLTNRLNGQGSKRRPF